MPRRLLAAALLAAGPAWAAPAADPACDGTWEGTLGTAPLMLQFNWDGFGAYYVGTALDGPVLRPREGAAREWEEYDGEGRQAATQQLECSGDTLRGERTSGGGQRTPVRARRAQDGSFNARRLAAAEVVAQRALSEQGRVVEIVAVRGIPQIVTARIRQPRGAEAAINQRLRDALLRQVDNHLQCRALVRAQGRFFPAGGDTLGLQRLDWRGSVLSVQFWLRGNCGGAEGYAGPQQFTFDTLTGAELPLAQWLLPEFSDGVPAGTAPHDTLVLPQILRGRRQLDELPESRRACAEFELAERARPLAVEGPGMVFGFHYSRRMAHCGLAFVLPWPALEPFLSDDGRRWRQAMLAPAQR